MKEIYLAGGCFWGVNHYFNLIKGIISTESGYAQSNIENPSYEDLCNKKSTAAEVVKVVYNEAEITLEKLLNYFFKIIDPTTLNRQGPDIGVQYRSGIYYVNDEEAEIKAFINNIQKDYDKAIVVEVEPLKNYFAAEEYHQDYLIKNPGGYCHVNFGILDDTDLK